MPAVPVSASTEAAIDAEVQRRAFSNGADAGVVSGLFGTTFALMARRATVLDGGGAGWADAKKGDRPTSGRKREQQATDPRPRTTANDRPNKQMDRAIVAKY